MRNNALAILRHLGSEPESKFTPGASGYRAMDGMGVELEVAEFLHALVRLTKPMVAIEYGTGSGYSTLGLALGMRDNEQGHLWSIEPDEEFRVKARRLLNDHGVLSHVSITPELIVGPTLAAPELLFFDSFENQRYEDAKRWFDSGVLACWHDAKRLKPPTWPHSEEWVLFHETPRGLWLGRL